MDESTVGYAGKALLNWHRRRKGGKIISKDNRQKLQGFQPMSFLKILQLILLIHLTQI